MKTYSCKICATTDTHQDYTVKEMMFGMRDVFTYFLCNQCGCLQLSAVPDNMSDYYPTHYYSFALAPPARKSNALYQWLYNAWTTYELTGTSLLGKALTWLQQKQIPVYHIFRKAGFAKGKKILDVGSGNGWLLHPIVNAGFHHIKGIDPYIETTIQYDNGLVILKKDLLVFEERGWDIIMFNHSFEHLDTPLAYLQQSIRLLKEDGICLLRLPTVSSGAWEMYQENWVQLDAPRHLFLHSNKSLVMLAENAGFTIVEVIQETNLFSIIASEQYVRDIPVYGDKRSYYEGCTTLFTDEQLEAYRTQQLQWEADGKADSIALILQKKTHTS